MLALVALAAVASAPPSSPAPAPAAPSVQATATVRIVSGVRLSLEGVGNHHDIPAPRTASVQVGGTAQPARLIEFQ